MAEADQKSPILPPLEWLRVFEAAGRLGNFTAAAQELNLTQAAVSQRIRALENALGVTLFVRQHRGVELTTDGEVYLPHVNAALGQLRRSTTDLFGKDRRKIRVAAPASVATFWLPARLQRIMRDAPGLEVSISTISRSTDFKPLHADFEVHFGDGLWSDRRAWEIFREELVPVTTPALAQSVIDWRLLPAISVASPRLGWRDWGAQFDRDIPSRIALRTDSFSIGLQACLAGAGVALGSLPICRPLIESRQLVALSSDVLRMSAGYWLCNGPDVVMDRRLKGFVEAVTDRQAG